MDVLGVGELGYLPSASGVKLREEEHKHVRETKATSVAVVGAGPVGLLTALALARRGFRKVRCSHSPSASSELGTLRPRSQDSTEA